MERVTKPKKLRSMRKLLRRCFRNVAPTLVPLEVWWDIVLGTDVRAMTLLAQTSKGFWQLVEEIRRRNLRIALEYRRIDQIPLAKRCLTLCANHGIPEAMFHIGYAKQHGGFGFKKQSNDWIKKASDAGYPLAMAMYLEECYSFMLEDAVLSSEDNCAIGYYHYIYALMSQWRCFGIKQPLNKAMLYHKSFCINFLSIMTKRRVSTGIKN